MFNMYCDHFSGVFNGLFRFDSFVLFCIGCLFVWLFVC
jgi:hypothetical protein